MEKEKGQFQKNKETAPKTCDLMDSWLAIYASLPPISEAYCLKDFHLYHHLTLLAGDEVSVPGYKPLLAVPSNKTKQPMGQLTKVKSKNEWMNDLRKKQEAVRIENKNRTRANEKLMADLMVKLNSRIQFMSYVDRVSHYERLLKNRAILAEGGFDPGGSKKIKPQKKQRKVEKNSNESYFSFYKRT